MSDISYNAIDAEVRNDLLNQIAEKSAIILHYSNVERLANSLQLDYIDELLAMEHKRGIKIDRANILLLSILHVGATAIINELIANLQNRLVAISDNPVFVTEFISDLMLIKDVAVIQRTMRNLISLR
jgi:hypothetical protein